MAGQHVKIGPKSNKRLEAFFKYNGFALIGSPFNDFEVTAIGDILPNDIRYVCLREFADKDIDPDQYLAENSKIFIQLPHVMAIKNRMTRKKFKSIFSIFDDLGLPVLPIYIVQKSDNGELYYDINTGGIINIHRFLKRNTLDSLKLYIEAQFKALRINFNLPELKGNLANSQLEPMMTPVDVDVLEAELSGLPDQKMVFNKLDYQVFICEIEDIPNIIKEIGRVRELTFRGVNEGTGRSFDLDNFDLHYHQLFIWNSKEKRIVAGYRLGIGPEIITKFGLNGMYISKLFKIKKKLIPILARSLEMGRSFVLPDYQKQRLPLYLLWRGILELLTINPSIDYLYGPVSISKSYSNISKDLIIEFIRANYFDNQLAKYLKPRKPYKVRRNQKEYKAIITSLDGKIAELDEFIENIEPTHLRLPVLIRQYIKQNARFIGFNLDPNFSDALDGFVILDLKKLPMATLELLKKRG